MNHVMASNLLGEATNTLRTGNEQNIKFMVEGHAFHRPVHTLAIVQAQVAAGIKSRQIPEIKRVFVKYSVTDVEDGQQIPHIPRQNLSAALKDLNISFADHDIANFYHATDLNSNGFIKFDEFKIFVQSIAPSPVEAWIQTLPLAKILTDAVPRVEFCDPLSVIASMTDQEVNFVVQGFALSLKAIFSEHIELLKKSQSLAEAQTLEQETEDSKFKIAKLSCGKLEDFHHGVHKRVGNLEAGIFRSHRALIVVLGACHLNFEYGMRAEHCTRLGSDNEFLTTNYGIQSTPKAEWEYIVEGRKPPEVAMKNGRRIPNIDELLKLELAMRSNLKRPEVIAVVLYTGPMFYVYNVILRQHPPAAYDVFQKGTAENLFPTTVFVLVSAVQKISRVMKLPENLRLYRGLGGTSELPDHFFARDGNGCRGFAEWGFMSTTANKEIAIQYSGVADRRSLLCVLEIRVGAVDRGACVRDLSQYPHEIEYLFVPCSFLEPDGPARAELAEDGRRVVRVFPVKVNANLKTQTVEELIAQRHDMHVTAFGYLIDDINQELRAAALTDDRARRRLASDRLHKPAGGDDDTVEAFLTRIVEQCNEVRNVHKAVNAEDFANNLVLRKLVLEMMEVKAMARSKLDEWLENTTSSFIRFRHNAKLRTVHRRYLHFLERKFSACPPDMKRAAAIRLCQVHGLISKDVHERNELDETRLMSAAAEGRPSRFVKLIVEAGAEVNAVRPDGVTAIWLAAQFGHKNCIATLIEMKGDVNLAAKNGATAVYIAAQGGNVDCIEKLVEHKADVNRPDNQLLTPVHQAAMNGHLDCIKVLYNLGADLNLCDAEQKTPFDLAMENHHQECIEFLRGHSMTEGVYSSPEQGCFESYGPRPGTKRLILSSGDISDIDGFLALAEYAKTRADVLFVMNYPAYIGVREGEVDELFADKNPGLGFRYTAKEIFRKETAPDKSYSDFLSNYDGLADNEVMKGAMTDMAFTMANAIWKEANAVGTLMFCIGGTNAVNPFSASAVKNEILVYSKLVPKPEPSKTLSTTEGTIYADDGSTCDLKWSDYSEIYIDFNGSMAFWDEHWNQTLSDAQADGKVKGVFIMGGVYADKVPVTMPAIPNVLNRFSSATMNQLYHPQRSAEFFAFVAQNKIPAFTITNNVVADLLNLEGVNNFMESNGLTGATLQQYAKAHYNSQYNPPKKPFDFYTAVALRTLMKDSGNKGLRCNPRQLFCNNVYGVTYVSSNNTWEATRSSYISVVDVSDNSADDEWTRSRKEFFKKEIALLKQIDSATSVNVFDIRFRLDDETKKLAVSATASDSESEVTAGPDETCLGNLKVEVQVDSVQQVGSVRSLRSTQSPLRRKLRQSASSLQRVHRLSESAEPSGLARAGLPSPPC